MEDGENAAKFLGIIESNSRRLTRLIDDLLTLSKLELGEAAMDMTAVRPASLCGEVAELLGERLREKGIRLDLDMNAGPELVLADRDRLFQVILNVMDNAVKYTPEGGSISITSRPSSEPGMAELVVSDTGVGIPPDVIHRIGERFFRVDAARSREMGGTGLGLAIVRHLMKAMDGTFDIASVPGKSTTVTLGLKISYAKV